MVSRLQRGYLALAQLCKTILSDRVYVKDLKTVKMIGIYIISNHYQLTSF